MISIISTKALLRVCYNTNLVSTVNDFHTSLVTYLSLDWRKKKRLSSNPNNSGPLVTLPDFTYKDNRPAPYGIGQLNRIKKHQEYVNRIMKLVGEIDHAVEKHSKLIEQQEVKRQKLLNDKLKPKGQLLVTDK